MLKRAITYESYDGETVTEDFYFHISKADLTKMELSKYSTGGLEASINRMLKAKDGGAIMEELDKIILTAVGEKSDDGRRFVKNDRIREDFQSSPAYEVIFMELCTDSEKAAAFIAACVPGNIDVTELQEKTKNVFEGGDPSTAETGTMRPAHPEADPTALEQSVAASPRVLTRVEVIDMPDDELRHLLATGQAVIGTD